jgi:hypothetical protein
MYKLIGGISAVFAILLTGCSTTSSGNWQEPRTTNSPFQNVLVVAATSYDDRRLELEDQLTDMLKSGDTTATASIHLEMKMAASPRSHENVLAALTETQADALLVLSLVDMQITPDQSQSKAYVNLGPHIVVIEDAVVTEIWASNYSIHETETQLITKDTARIQAVLYDIADSGRAIYTLNVKTKFKEEGGEPNYDLANNVAKAVSKKLRHAGLVN